MNASSNATSAYPAALWQRLSALLYGLFPLLALWLVIAGLSYWIRGAQPVAPGSLAAWAEFALLWLVTALYAVVSWRFRGQRLACVLGVYGWSMTMGNAQPGLRCACVLRRRTVRGRCWVLVGCGHSGNRRDALCTT